VDFMIDSLGAVSSLIRGDQLKLLAIASGERMDEFPGVPTLAETYPGLAVSSWLGLVAPPGVPDEIVDKLVAGATQAFNSPTYRKLLENRGSRPAKIGPDAFASHLDTERERVEKTIVKAGLKLD